MLQSIRDRTQGVFAWVVVIILVIIFVLWGLSSYLTSSQSSKTSVVATVDKQKIYKQEYNQVYQNAYQQQAQIHAGNINLVDTSALRKQVLQGLVEQEVLFQNAKKLDMGLTTEMVDQLIQHSPYFLQDGVFSEQKMNLVLSQMGYDINKLRNNMRKSILINQVQISLLGSDFALPNELSGFQKLQNQLREFRYLMIKLSDINLEKSDYNYKKMFNKAAITKYYNDNLDKFKTIPKVKIQYILLSYDKIKKDIKPSSEQLELYYSENLTDQQKKEPPKKLESEKQKLKKAYIESQAQKKYEDLGNQLQQLTFENPSSLDIASESLNLPIKETNYFSQNQTDFSMKQDKNLLDIASVRKLAFSDDVLDRKINSDIVNLPGKRALVLRVADYKPVKNIPLYDAYGKIHNILLQKAKSKKLNVLLDKLKSLSIKDANLYIKSHHWVWGDLQTSARDNKDINSSLLNAVFNTPPVLGLGSDQQPLHSVHISGDNIAVYQVQKIILDKSKPKSKQDIDKQLPILFANMVYQSYVNQQVSAAKVVYNNKN